jgi:hypothetical protein
MTLTDEKVAELAEFTFDPAWQMHDGVEYEEIRALALEVQTARARRCDACTHWRGPTWEMTAPYEGVWVGRCAHGIDQCGGGTMDEFSCALFTPNADRREA